MSEKRSWFHTVAIIPALTGCLLVAQVSAEGTASNEKDVVVAATVSSAATPIDFVNARPLPLPGAPRFDRAAAAAASAALPSGAPGVRRGRSGSGKLRPQNVGAPVEYISREVSSQQFGWTEHPFTTARVDAQNRAVSRFYPFSAAGKLFFNIGTDTYVCSAALVQRGVVVTAAHCVAGFGTNTRYSNFTFVPAYNRGSAPFGVWSVKRSYVKSSYLDGTDDCAYAGVICKDDVAVLTLASQTDADTGLPYYAGESAGWLSVGWDGYGFTPGNETQITQLGYPVALDDGARMQRTDSIGFTDAGASSNTIIGSLQTGGSSGGPWIVNLGMRPTLNGTSFGTDADPNVVVGVTSWGYTDTGYKQQGASRFTSWNIVKLLDQACANTPAVCTP